MKLYSYYNVNSRLVKNITLNMLDFTIGWKSILLADGWKLMSSFEVNCLSQSIVSGLN